MLKKVVKYVLIFLIFYLIAFSLYNSKPPAIDSSIGNINDVNTFISKLEKNEKVKIIITETDYAKNEMTYKIYSSEKFDIDKIQFLTPLSSFIIDYDNEDTIETINYNFNLNFKSYKEILETLIRSTFIDITDHGYEEIEKYIKIDSIDKKKEKFKRRNYISSNKNLTIEYNSEKEEFSFNIK